MVIGVQIEALIFGQVLPKMIIAHNYVHLGWVAWLELQRFLRACCIRQRYDVFWIMLCIIIVIDFDKKAHATVC